mgnify:CR=1 FL=1
MESGVSRDHGTKRKEEKDLTRNHEEGGASEREREEAGGVEGVENEDQEGEDEEGIGE